MPQSTRQHIRVRKGVPEEFRLNGRKYTVELRGIGYDGKYDIVLTELLNHRHARPPTQTPVNELVRRFDGNGKKH